MSDLHLLERRDPGQTSVERAEPRGRARPGTPVALPPEILPPKRRSIWRKAGSGLVKLAVLAAIAAAGYLAWQNLPTPTGGRGGGRFAVDGPVPVLVSPVATADVPVTLDAVGTVQALNNVTVRSQVDGRLIEVAFREGQDVKKGDVIARIDPTTYQAQYDQARAKKSQDEANLANARRDYQRSLTLIERNYTSRQTADTQEAQVAQLEAQIRADQAMVDNAKAYLDYSTVLAPIDGRTGLRQVDEGNIIRAGDPSGLVTITQVKPIALVFNLAQQHLRAVNTARAKGSLMVEALDGDNRSIVDRGTLDVVDNQVDQATGTVRMKAIFPNTELQLWPGQFVNVRLFVSTLAGATVVPTSAVQRGPKGSYVYVLGEGDKVIQRTVAITQQDDRRAVVATGVVPGEKVVTTGFARLNDGESVRPTDAQVAAEAAASDAAAPAPARAWGDRRAGEGRRGEGGERRRSREGGGERGGPGAPAPGGASSR